MFFLKFTRNGVPVLVEAERLVMVELGLAGSLLTVETISGNLQVQVDESPTEIYILLQEIEISQEDDHNEPRQN